MAKIIVTGVDGNFGGLVVDTITKLVDKESLILTCPFEAGLEKFKKEGFDTRVANFNHREGLEKAFEGGDVILVISAPFVGEKRQTAHKNAVDAAKAAGVKKVVYTSLVNATDPQNPSIEKIDHAFTEEYVQSIGMDYIFLRNSQYAEAMITSYLTSNGAMASCQGDGKMSYISRKDCAIAAAYALTKEEMHKRILNINGPESLTLAEFIAIGNEKTGMNVVLNDVSEEDVYHFFDSIGVPRTTEGQFEKDSPAPYSSDGMVTFARAIRLDKMSEFTNDFELLTGTKPRTIAHMFANYDEYQVGQRNSTDN
ncbi:NmrA family NAD(P)-binding protein [Konateibacter massiliensis]|uniref:NmrA family NAD(P)-binding protein n=1 Tax=Konateibacter massiliensis TaxID=2002841 RepID=UPI000C161259|nr:NmrA family NAD(P)-binding protein [Konateibacter massiliensis]